jgi:hypothetical protein
LGVGAVSARWYLAKYVADPQRNEPRNIGLILVDSGRILTKFVGQRANGLIDGRTARFPRSLAVYKAWVSYWASLTESGDVETLLAEARKPLRGENFHLEPGGEVLLGRRESVTSSEQLLDDLYTRLVEDPVNRGAESAARLADRVIESVQQRIGHQIQRDSVVTVQREDVIDELSFDYRYNNGKAHLMQRVTLTYTDNRSWNEVHAVAWSFQQVQQARDATLRGADLIALVKLRHKDTALERQLRQLEAHANVVDLSLAEQAETQLVDLLAGG